MLHIEWKQKQKLPVKGYIDDYDSKIKEANQALISKDMFDKQKS